MVLRFLQYKNAYLRFTRNQITQSLFYFTLSLLWEIVS